MSVIMIRYTTNILNDFEKIYKYKIKFNYLPLSPPNFVKVVFNIVTFPKKTKTTNALYTIFK